MFLPQKIFTITVCAIGFWRNNGIVVDVTSGKSSEEVRGRSEILPKFNLGQASIVGFPGELTSLAGTKLRTAILGKRWQTSATTDYVAICGYASEYCQYVATERNYFRMNSYHESLLPISGLGYDSIETGRIPFK